MLRRPIAESRQFSNPDHFQFARSQRLVALPRNRSNDQLKRTTRWRRLDVSELVETMHKLEMLGGLKCHILDDLNAGQKPELVVVLAHGFGAGGDDLVSVGRALLQRVPRLAETTQFIFPAAPLSLEHIGMSDGRAWWMIDVNQLTEAARTGTFRNLTKDNPEARYRRRGRSGAVGDFSSVSGPPLDPS